MAVVEQDEVRRAVVLRRAGVCVAIDSSTGWPVITHWGADVDVPAEGGVSTAVPLVPGEASGWPGRPAVAGNRQGRWPFLRLTLNAPAKVDDDGPDARCTLTLSDDEAQIGVTVELVLTADGVLSVGSELRNGGEDAWQVDALRCVMPIPAHAVELLDFTGRWALERQPQRGALRDGAHVREVRRGRTGFDSPLLLCAGTDGFGHRHGEVWAVHVGWSGNHEHYAERVAEGRSVIGGGELLESGEVRLEAGASYRTPVSYFVWSDTGLDGISSCIHSMLRRRTNHPTSARPVTLNAWEAVYFSTDTDKLMELARLGAEVGVERFVVDDGWFRGRRNDTAGLGDWYVDETVWPDGLHPLVNHVRDLGMEFGLWVEPEMVNPDSDLYRAHPDWVLAGPGRLPAPQRHQHVLDIANPAASAYVLERLETLIDEYELTYLKWDHNRDLVEPIHDMKAGVHAQTLATYALLDELRARHPNLEIESCSSGGARVDLGILARTDRVWTSDNLDAIDRQHIQRGTSLLLPPELMGAHIGSTKCHVTGRTFTLRMRAITALFGHLGIEWDLTSITAAERQELRRWVELYKRLRPLLHTGTVVRADMPAHGTHLVHGVVAQSGTQAVFAYVQLTPPPSLAPQRVRLPGLTPDRRYAVTAIPEETPGGLVGSGKEFTGKWLGTVGLELSLQQPANALLLELVALA